jgi:hypothetical protein
MDRNRKLKEKCFWSSDISFMLGLELGYRTTSFAPALPHPLLALSHASMQHKAHPSQSGLTKMVATASSVRQFQSDAFALSLDRNKNGLGPPLPSHTVSSATRTHLTTTKMTAPCGRSVIGVLPLTMPTMIALLHIMDAL